MARPQFVQARPTVLDVSISDTETTEIVLQKLVALGNVPLSMADFGEVLELTFNPGGINEEVISCTDFVVADDGRVTINEGILRARSGKSPYTTGGTAFAHDAGTIVIVSNATQMYDRILTYAEGMANSGAADASLTGKGLVEGATTAEINAGTELGATGAMLFVNPLYLATSIYSTRLPTAAEKAKLAEIIGVSFFAGDGSDGPLNVTSGTYTIDLSVKTVWQFSSVNISLGATLNFSNGTAGDKVPVIKCKGNFTNDGTITTVGLGPAGGTGGAALNNGTAAGTAGSGTHGTACTFPFVDGTVPGSGRLGTGASRATGGTDGTGGTGGALAPKNSTYFFPYAINGTGAGGGGGGLSASVGTPGAGSAGGAGSLGLVLEIGGNFTNTGTINLNGQNGTNGLPSVGNGSSSWNSGAGGGGGGGAAGSLVCRYQGTFTNSGTITANGGTAGAGGLSTNKGASGGSPVMGGGGGGGSGGANAFNASTAGSNGGSEAGGAGGVGANGILFFEKVTS